MSAILCLNKNSNKSLYDSITFAKTSSGFCATYRNDLGGDGENLAKYASPQYIDTEAELMEYLNLTLDLLIADTDVTPHESIDLLMKGFPIVSLKLTERNKDLILKTFKFWIKY